MELINQKITNLIENNPMAFATIQGKTKKPYVVGVACCKVVDRKIVITDNFMNTTIENIKKNNNVALVVWDNKLNGYQFLGKCKYYTKGKWLKFVKNLKENKNMPVKGVIIVDIRHIIKSK